MKTLATLLTLGMALTMSSDASSNTIKVMTFNLRYASAPDGNNTWENSDQSPERREVALSVLAGHAPDIIGFQEGENQQLDYLAANLPGYTFESQKPSGGSGNENAAFAFNTNKLLLLDRGVISLGNSPGGGYWNNDPATPFDPWDIFPENLYNFPRLALWGHFEWLATGQHFLFYSTHFDVFNGSNNGESQVKSATLVCDDALSRNDGMPASPLSIVVGDFNGSQNDRAWKLFTGSYTNDGITGDFSDSWYDVHSSWTDSGTMHNFNGGTVSEASRIDWILHRGGWTATQAQILADSAISTNQSGGGTHTMYPSDHYPVLAHLVLPEPPPDFDKDGLPDALELASPLSSPTDPDSDDDGVPDGAEDLNGNGTVDGGETDPSSGGHTQNPTDIRTYQMDGILDTASSLLEANGLELHWQFDGRYLYVATQDAGEGNDHFIHLTSNPSNPVPAPWAKAGQVSQWDAYLADEDGGDFEGWFDASGSAITNEFAARSATYYQNGGWLEGVIDLANLYGSGFTSSFYLAAAPYPTTDGGALYAPAQVPSGNGDGDILGNAEYIEVSPDDMDGDGISDYADPDKDGDQLPDSWEEAHGLDPTLATGTDGADGDIDGDGFSNLAELRAGTNASDPLSVIELQAELAGTDLALKWPALYEHTYLICQRNQSLSGPETWTCIYTNGSNTVFPTGTNTLSVPVVNTSTAFFRVRIPL